MFNKLGGQKQELWVLEDREPAAAEELQLSASSGTSMETYRA